MDTILHDPIAIAETDQLKDRQPAHALVDELDLVIVPLDDDIHVYYDRCAHRGALLADGFVSGRNLIWQTIT